MEAHSQQADSERKFSGWRLFMNLFGSVVNALGWTAQAFKWE